MPSDFYWTTSNPPMERLEQRRNLPMFKIKDDYEPITWDAEGMRTGVPGGEAPFLVDDPDLLPRQGEVTAGSDVYFLDQQGVLHRAN